MVVVEVVVVVLEVVVIFAVVVVPMVVVLDVVVVLAVVVVWPTAVVVDVVAAEPGVLQALFMQNPLTHSSPVIQLLPSDILVGAVVVVRTVIIGLLTEQTTLFCSSTQTISPLLVSGSRTVTFE